MKGTTLHDLAVIKTGPASDHNGLTGHTPARTADATTTPTKEDTMRIALCFSRQLANQYAGGVTDSSDSEGAWMQRLAAQVAPLLRSAGIVCDLHPGTDINHDGSTDYKDEVAWSKQSPQAAADLLISLHSNASGDSVVLCGTSKASGRYQAAMIAALATHCPMPYADTWTASDKKVAILTESPQPALLIEVGRHDTTDYADWLRTHITNGTLAVPLAAAILAATTGGGLPTTPPSGDAAQLVETIAAAADQLKEMIK